MAASPRASTHSALASPSRVALIDRIRASDRPLDAHALAQACNLHVTTVRFHLDALIRAGLITSRSAGSHGRGRPRLLYAAVMRTSEGEEPPYEQLSRLLLRAMTGPAEGTPAERAEAAGREWAEQHLAPSGAADAADGADGAARVEDGRALEDAAPKINAFFTELGFEPDAAPPDAAPPDAAPPAAARPSEDAAAGLEFTLHSCPFLAAAREHPEIVCRIHLGLMRGALDRFGAAGHRTGLEPWATPHTCRAHVGAEPDGPRA